jgi:hypothetical protein
MSCLELPRAPTPAKPWTSSKLDHPVDHPRVGALSAFWSQELQILPRGSDPRPEKTTRLNPHHSPPQRTVITLDTRHLLSRRGAILLRWPTHPFAAYRCPVCQSEDPSTAACPPWAQSCCVVLCMSINATRLGLASKLSSRLAPYPGLVVGPRHLPSLLSGSRCPL